MPKHRTRKILISRATCTLAACALAGCGGSGGDAGTGQLNIAVTDAPVDGVTEVRVAFDGITLKPANGPQREYHFDTPRTIDLKALTDGRIESLLDERVPAGRYNWMKLDVNAEIDGVFDSYVIIDSGGQIELRIPSDRLKLGNGFTVTQDGETAFVIEWNLRMGLTNPVGQPGYKLQPSLRITDMTQWGAIAGTVETGLITDASCTQDSDDGNVVYVFEGSPVVPDDIDGISPDPLTTADVRLNIATGNHEYYAPFLAPGNYTVAFTCQGTDDAVPDADMPGSPVDDAITFTNGISVMVANGDTTTVDFGTP